MPNNCTCNKQEGKFFTVKQWERLMNLFREDDLEEVQAILAEEPSPSTAVSAPTWLEARQAARRAVGDPRG